MDDDDEQEFSKGVVFGFFEQAQQTFTEIEAAMYVERFGFPPTCLKHTTLMIAAL